MGGRNRSSRPQRTVRRTADFTPSNPDGGEGLAAAARHATPFNANEPTANSKQGEKASVNASKNA